MIAPIEKLKLGLDEIAKGNYNVKVECQTANDIGLLISSFNEIAQKLYDSEKLQTEYEENRKTLINS
ncbi:HAMP domain-containing protein [Sporomusa ovata]|uniref:HAMP domain-containing protein n=1 Tax=Sporomusa ovata TaxID=2378 RepID=UPI0009DC09A3|nr:HAMP domain-containing protein [Sporomusa ovata]